MEGSRRLPHPQWERLGNLGQALEERRSIRSFSRKQLEEGTISIILAAANGVTDTGQGLRTAPSGGACYPLDTYLVSAAGVEEYVPEEHSLTTVRESDVRAELARHAYQQACLAEAPVTVAICADYHRITGRYGRRGIRYAILEAGHIAQNIHLAAASLGLGSVAVGAFDDDSVAAALGVEGSPLYLIPVGIPATV
ncbi:MAG: SagB/ThcOx family dehydrogenase [bacterium]|nr:MAG: SagB/ThcOx family dehydrogenase [bacterium]